MDPEIKPEVQHLCVLNQAGFDLFWDLHDKKTDKWMGRSSTYPINQQECYDVSAKPNAVVGNELELRIQAIGGVNNAADRAVRVAKNGARIT